MKRLELSEAEKYIMDQFWQHGAMTGNDVAKLVRQKGWKRTTLYTFLARLIQKGMLRVEKGESANTYVCNVTKESYGSELGRQFLEEMYGGRAKDFLASMITSSYLTQDDIHELQEWLVEQGGQINV